MTPLVIGLLGAMLLPFFVSTWRMSLFALALQGAFMTALALRLKGGLSVEHLVTFVDFAVVRSLIVPLALYGVLRKYPKHAIADVASPTMLSWTLAFGLVLLAFRFAEHVLPEDGDARILVAVSASALLLGLLILATRPGLYSQIAGAIRIENGIALFELGGAHRHEGPVLAASMTAIVLSTVLLYAWYLRTLARGETVPKGPAL